MENKKPLIIGGAILLGIFITLLIFNLSSGKITGFAITSPIKTCKNVQVPYDVQEEYQVPLKFEVLSAKKGTTTHGFDVWATADVVVRNVDSETGTFTVSQTLTTLNEAPQTKQSTHYIVTTESFTYHEEFDVDLGEDFNINYEVTPSKKTLSRTITKYRTEERCS